MHTVNTRIRKEAVFGVLLFPSDQDKLLEAPTVQSVREITRLLQRWSDGDQDALEELTPMVYRELQQAARRCMAGERPGHSLQATSLVNETFLRLIDWKTVRWQSRAHFFSLCAKLMRHILIDFARARQVEKRGGGDRPLPLEEALCAPLADDSNLAELDTALKRLEEIDSRKGQVVELRFFGGLSVEEIAEVLNISPATVMRDWKVARVWLLKEISSEGFGES